MSFVKRVFNSPKRVLHPPRIRRFLINALEWISIIIGLLVVGSCSMSAFSEDPWAGGLTFVATLFIACIVVGFVVLVAGFSDDMMTLRTLQEGRIVSSAEAAARTESGEMKDDSPKAVQDQRD